MTFGLAVAGADGVAADRVVRSLWAADLAPDALAVAECAVDMDGADAICPACGATFDTAEPRCTDCGLRFARG